jgi:hypothetical protein
MNDVLAPARADAASLTVSSHSLATLDTTTGSVLHWFYHRVEHPTRVAAREKGGRVFALLKFYFIVISSTYVPLLASAVLSGVPLISPTRVNTLPFLSDLNVMFMFVFSLPCLSILIVTDQVALTRSFKSVLDDGTITIPKEEELRLVAGSHKTFRVMNLVGQIGGILLGGAVAYMNYVSYTPVRVGFWIARGGHLLPVGFVFLYCIFAFYAVVAIYVARNIAFALLIRELAGVAELHMLPLHPDKSAGLRPIGRLGLRNQYALTLLGVNIVLLLTISKLFLDPPGILYGLIGAGAVAYLILGPVVFMGPLLPFRGAMQRNKAELMSEVARRLRVELERLRTQLQGGAISKDDEELIERLRKIGAVIDELPVWPFDAGTLRRFLTAYAVPVLTTVSLPVVSAVLKSVKVWPLS